MSTKKTKKIFICNNCGNELPAWQGQCNMCGSWGTIKEYNVGKEDIGKSGKRVKISTPQKLIDFRAGNYQRYSTGIYEFDRVLGGGIVPGSLILLSGEPGIGKSTLITETANNIATGIGNVIYAGGEESGEQIKIRADRICKKISEKIYIYSETDLDRIIQVAMEMQPKLLIIDSIQTMHTRETDGVASGISQLRMCTNLLMNFAKENNIPIIIVAHVNKNGDLAGPKMIEHMVDTVLYFRGERDRDLRILSAVKNRFGNTEEIGAFSMGESGMTEVKDISGSLLEESDLGDEGSIISATYEGSRPVFFEIQALVTPANVGFARRTAIGIDVNRLNMMLAVLEKSVGISLINYDVYVNIVGGLKPDNTCIDLAVITAIASSYKNKGTKNRMVSIGEVGLTGNLRSVKNAEKIIYEAGRLGYVNILLPDKNISGLKKSPPEINLIKAKNVKDAIVKVLG